MRRGLAIAAPVGTILSATNQYDVIAHAQFTPRLWVKLLLNFTIPFTVSMVSAALNYGAGRESTHQQNS
ncbi:MAG TPA: hypothetical protein VLT16_18920 [Candidatus Limnocylindrales bacterium]|nr:hypothetical protein [Candidatus Limnocylindrales bacterium]